MSTSHDDGSVASGFLPIAGGYDLRGLARLLAESAEIEPTAQAVLGRLVWDCESVQAPLRELEDLRRRHDLDPDPASFQHALWLSERPASKSESG